MIEQRRILDSRALCRLSDSSYIANLGYDQSLAEQALQQDACDLVAFGVPFLANPDSFYQGQEKGAIDYPFISASAPA